MEQQAVSPAREHLYARLERTVKALRENRMEAQWVKTKEEALAVCKETLTPGATVAAGGSVTLAECGVMDLLRGGDYHFLDREAVAPEEIPALYRKAFSADFFLMSSNAVTEQGELYNVDGNGNRVAALIYGPKKVIVIAGENKLCADIPEAVRRVKRIAAPVNAMRLKQETPCASCGVCAGIKGDLAAGCRSQQRICCSYVVSGYQRVADRIKVILVAEPLGF